jgi:hypothetical protein
LTDQKTDNIEMTETEQKLTEEENKERKRAYQREYRLKNMDNMRDAQKKWQIKIKIQSDFQNLYQYF